MFFQSTGTLKKSSCKPTNARFLYKHSTSCWLWVSRSNTGSRSHRECDPCTHLTAHTATTSSRSPSLFLSPFLLQQGSESLGHLHGSCRE